MFVYPNTGNGTLGAPFSITTGASFSVADVAVADFDQNGKLDVAAANADTNHPAGSLSILLGDGLGGFASTTNVPLSWHPISMKS